MTPSGERLPSTWPPNRQGRDPTLGRVRAHDLEPVWNRHREAGHRLIELVRHVEVDVLSASRGEERRVCANVSGSRSDEDERGDDYRGERRARQASPLQAEMASDDHPLHLVRALADLQDLLVAVQP